jgi:hypothetical protein
MHKIAGVAVVLVLAFAGLVATRARIHRRPALPAAPSHEARRAVVPADTIPSPAPENAVDTPDAPTAAAASSLRPWPLEFPPASWPDPVRRTWEKLRQRVTLDFTNTSAVKVLEWLSSEIGVPILIDPAVLGDLNARMISMRISGLIADGCLKLMLGPSGLAFEIQDDGSIRVAKEDQLSRRYEKEGAGILARQRSLERVTEFLSKGWNGTDADMDPLVREVRERLRGPGTVSAHNDSLEDIVMRLRETTKLNIVIDAALRDEMGRVTATSTGTLQEILDEVARSAGVGVCVGDGVVIFTRVEAAERSKAGEADAQRAHQADVASLTKPLKAGSMTVADFAKALEAATGLPVMPSKELWEGGAAVSIPAGATARTALEASGMRWAVYGGRIWLIR